MRKSLTVVLACCIHRASDKHTDKRISTSRPTLDPTLVVCAAQVQTRMAAAMMKESLY